ncbi:hypothetical protein [Mycobacterium sp. AZCC_0083]|uniref:hypothetical protein n=1 Tax=Mycobacterium sp. AZCC_0083 TaxID=2735882 RepID=UPI001617D447|nr:hypothetical protein [Mycobacterium sp. AZCC_0083]MBB5161576.1 hypothetical protein [Mycobacterium sp. AZCC_0083]
MDPEDAALIATANAELVGLLSEAHDDGLAEALSEMQAEENERMAPFWDAVEKSNAELIEILRGIEASPERQEFLATLAEINEEWRRDIVATLAELPAMQLDQLG